MAGHSESQVPHSAQVGKELIEVGGTDQDDFGPG